MATHARHVAAVVNDRAMRERALEQRLLEASDRDQRERWLRREGPQVACALGLAAQGDHVATDDPSRSVISLAPRLQQ